MKHIGRAFGGSRPAFAGAGKKFLLAFALASAGIVGNAAADNADLLSHRDRAFVDEAAQAGIGQIALGERAEQSAASAPVREFASRMVNDHAKVDARLRAISERDGFAFPHRLTSDDQKKADRLARAHAEQFDAVYMADQAANHRKTIAAFEREAREGDNPDLRRFAADMLPTLRDDLHLVQSAEQQMSAAERNALRDARGVEASKKGTGATHVAAQKNERMPVEETGQ